MDRSDTMRFDFEIPYAPTAIYYEASDSLEYVRLDEACVYRRIDDMLTLILSMKTRKPLGFKFKGFHSIYLDYKRKHKIQNENEFPLLICIIEEAVQKLGDHIFERRDIQDAYNQARSIAEEDKVRLAETPKVA